MLSKNEKPDDVLVIDVLQRASMLATYLFEQYAGRELTARQFAILHAVSQTKGGSQTALVSLTGIDRSTLSDVVERLVKRGLLRRRRDQKDTRVWVVRLTPDGEEALKRGEAVARKVEEAVLACVPAARRGQFLDALTKIGETTIDAPSVSRRPRDIG